jgi:hypothetical protein
MKLLKAIAGFTLSMFRDNRAELVVVLCALLLYAPAIGWGLPNAINSELTHPWSPDDIAPLGPLTEVHNTFIEAKPNRFVAYPLMHYGIVTVAYLPYLSYLLVSGALAKPSAVFPYGFLDPVESLRLLALIARSVTVLMAAGTVLAACLLGRSLWNRTCGLVAGVFVMLLYPMFYYSRTGNLDVPALFWAALGLVVYARIVRDAYTVRRAIWLGIFAALSAGTKDQGATLFLLMPLAMLPLEFRRREAQSHAKKVRVWIPAAVTVAAGALAYLVSSGFIFRPERFLAHVNFILGGGTVYFGHPATVQGYAQLALEIIQLLADSMSWPLLILALIGIGVSLFHDRRALTLLLPVLGLLLIVIVPTRYVELRFVMPIGFVLAVFAAIPIGLGLRSPLTQVRAAVVLVLILICVLPLTRGLDLTHAMLWDSRYAAADWFKQSAGAGDHIEFFGPYSKLPHFRSDVQLVRAVKFVGTSEGVRYTNEEISEMGREIKQRASRYVLVMPDHSSKPEFPYGITCPTELYSLLRDGSLGYRRIAYFETPPLMPWADRPPLDYPVVNPPIEIFVRTTAVEQSQLSPQDH